MKTLILYFLFFINFSFLSFSQNFFPIKTGDKFQFQVIESHDEPGISWEHTTYNKSIVTEVNTQGKTYYLYKGGLFRYDSLNLKIYRIVNNSEKLAYDFTKQPNETDTLYITGVARLFTYQADSYINLWGANRLVKKASWAYQSSGTESGEIQIVDGIGLYKKYQYYLLGQSYDVTKDFLISAIIDSSVYNQLTLSVTATLPDCISTANNQFSINCNINAQYAVLVDTLKAEVNIASDNNVLYTGVFYRSGESGPIAVNLPSALLVPPHSVNIKVICKDKSIFENIAQYPDTGFVNIPCQTSCGLWSVLEVPNFYHNAYGITLKFFTQTRGRIIIQPTGWDNPLWDTYDGGNTWLKWNGGNYYADKNQIMVDNLYGFILDKFSSIIRTTNGGSEFVTIYSRNGNANYSLSFIDRFNGWVAVNYQESQTDSYPAILKTTNSGDSWSVIRLFVGQPNEIDFVSENAGWLQTTNGNLYKSIDGGNNWSQISSIPDYNIIYMKDTLTGWAIGSGVARTSDGGVTWIKKLSGNFWDAHFFDSNSGWILGKDSLNQRAVFFTGDGGLSWIRKEFGITNEYLLIDFIDRQHGWILCSDGVLLRTVDSGITFVNDKEYEIPNDFYISQNYPNPFNPITTIRYEIPTRSNVNISVFNILGELVSVLVNEIQEPKTYEIKFDASLLPSGIYIYRITAENYSYSQKMVLIK